MTRSVTVARTKATASKATSAASKRAEDLIALIARRKARIAEDFYDIGQALTELRKKKLYVALGYTSFAELLEQRAIMSVRTAEKLIEIVRGVPRPRALELGPEKAYALSRLVATTPELDTIDSVLEEGVRIGKTRKPLAGASTREFEATTRAVRRTSKPADPREREGDRAARALQAAARAAGAKGATATARRASGGYEVVLRVDVGVADALVRALR